MNELIPNDLKAYFDKINQIPKLDADEEKEMAKRLEETGDVAAAQRLILGNLWFVVQVARQYVGYGLPFNDLVQEGNIGLMKAVKKFSTEYDVRLNSYAVHWIKSEIHEYVIKNWKPAKIATTKAQRKVFFNLRKNKKRAGWMNYGETIELAEKLNVKPDDITEMERRIYNVHPQLTDAPIADDAPQKSQLIHTEILSDGLPSPEESFEEDEHVRGMHIQLHTAINSLDERSRDIIQKRWFDENKSTLHELAAEYQVSAERIRQLEANAIKKMKNTIQV